MGKTNYQKFKKLSNRLLQAVLINNKKKKRIHHSYSKLKRVFKVRTLKSPKSLRKSSKIQQLRVQNWLKKRTSMMKKLKLIIMNNLTTCHMVELKSKTTFVMVTKQTFITITTTKWSTNTNSSFKILLHLNLNIKRTIAKHAKKRD